MAPEAPGNIVILDVAETKDGFECDVDRFEPSEALSAFWVIWSATGRVRAVDEGQPARANYVSAGGGVLNVLAPQGAKRFQYRARIQGQRDLLWRDVVHGDGLMLVVILPRGYVLPSVDQGVIAPTPHAFKEFDGRLAYFWRLTNRGEDNQINVRWRMEPVGDRDLAEHCAWLSERAARIREFEAEGTPDIGTYVDPSPQDEPPDAATGVPIEQTAPPNAPHDVLAATSDLLRVMTHWTFLTGILVSLVGVILVFLGEQGDTGFELFGQTFESTSVGIAAIFIGVVMIILNIRKILGVAVRQAQRGG